MSEATISVYEKKFLSNLRNLPDTPVVIIGNIASGKSEVCKALKKMGAQVCFEPVDLWENIGILGKFYEDVEKPAAQNNSTPTLFQMFAFSSRLVDIKMAYALQKKRSHEDTEDSTTQEDEHVFAFDQQDEQTNNTNKPTPPPSPAPLSRLVVTDSHVEIDRHVFAQMLMESGAIPEMHRKIYENSYEHWQMIVPRAMPAMIIYLRSSPAKCLERAIKRNRDSEKKLKLPYLKALHKKFELYVATQVSSLKSSYNYQPPILHTINVDGPDPDDDSTNEHGQRLDANQVLSEVLQHLQAAFK